MGLNGIRRTVVVTRVTQISAMSVLNGHQWNHSNSVISRNGSCRKAGTALPIEL